jgi:hypothetical protein
MNYLMHKGDQGNNYIVYLLNLNIQVLTNCKEDSAVSAQDVIESGTKVLERTIDQSMVVADGSPYDPDSVRDMWLTIFNVILRMWSIADSSHLGLTDLVAKFQKAFISMDQGGGSQGQMSK